LAFTFSGGMFPCSRALVSLLSDADLSKAAFPFGTGHAIEVGQAMARATRIT